MLSKSMRCPQNFKGCSWHLSTKWAQFFLKITSNHMSHIQCYKSWMFGLERFAHLPYSSDHSPTNDHFSKHLDIFQRKCFHSQQEAENVFQEFIKSPNRFLCYWNEQTYFLLANILIVIVPILINKNVFKPSYNYLNFMVQNCNYFSKPTIVPQVFFVVFYGKECTVTS